MTHRIAANATPPEPGTYWVVDGLTARTGHISSLEVKASPPDADN